MRYICYKGPAEYWVVETLNEALKIKEEYGGTIYEMLKINTYTGEKNESV